MADLRRIRARLSGARRDAERLLEGRQRPLEEPAALAGPPRTAELALEHERTLREKLETERDELEAALDRTDAERAEAERRVAALERELSAGGAELRKVQILLEEERARGELRNGDAEGTGRAERKRRASRSEKRIAELEGELETERELRKDFELALELLQQQQAENVGRVASADEAGRPAEPAGLNAPGREQVSAEGPLSKAPPQAEPDPAPAEPSRESPERPPGIAPDGWGVPLAAFPEDGSEEGRTGVGKSPGVGERKGPRSPLRRRSR